MEQAERICPECNRANDGRRYFCEVCGAMLRPSEYSDQALYGIAEKKMKRIVGNLARTPHIRVVWNDRIDQYVGRVEKYRALLKLPEIDSNGGLSDKIEEFMDMCTKPEFQIAFVGTIKTGKSTLINALLGHNYASVAVTPETAALTKFRRSPKDYIRVSFYTKQEWTKLWKSRTSGADAFNREYRELNADKCRERWVGHSEIYKEIPNSEIEKELAVWSSSRSAEHYFVREIEVGISSLPDSIPGEVVLVDTPGLSDPVTYRSEISKQYIEKANAVFVCVQAQRLDREELETISSVFAYSAHNKNKVHIVATQWDRLNDPVNDWKAQMVFWERQLTGKAYFDKTEMARKNIMYSAAHIYNLCRDFDKLSAQERKTMARFAVAMDIDLYDLESHIQEMQELSNVNRIREIVFHELAEKYQILLRQDLEKKYLSIMYDVKRIAQEGQKDAQNVINLSNTDINSMRQRIKEQQANYDAVLEGRKQLMAVLNVIEQNTRKRLEDVTQGIEGAASGKMK